MPIMTKMRDNMPAILFGLVIVFLFSIMFDWGMDYLGYSGSNRDVVGEVAGKKLKYQDFANMIQQQVEQQKNQTGTELDDNAIRQIREQVWNSFVVETLLEKKAEELGISVTDQEIVDWVRGANPPQFLIQQFRDSLGNFNRAAYDAALNDPRNKEIWIDVELSLRKQRLFEKIQSVVLSSVRVTPGEVLQKFTDQSIQMNIEYAFFDPNKYVNEKEISISDDEIKKYFNENQVNYKINANRKIRFVTFNTTPSSKDSLQVIQELEAIKKQAESGINFIELQKTNMDKPIGEQTIKHGETMAEKEKVLFASKVGDIVGPIKDYDGLQIVKILDKKSSSNTFVKASHILFADNSEGENKAKEILSRAKKGENFSKLAKEFSTEPGAKESGGDLGWFGKGRMVKPFEDAVFKGKTGEIIGPVKTQFGFHVIKIEGKDNSELKIASIVMPVKISSQTLDDVYQRAQDFSYLAKKGNFSEEAKSLGLTIQESGSFEEKGFIPGIGMMESINRFVFKNDVDEVSDVYNTQNGIVVFQISEVKEKSVRPIEEVSNEIKLKLIFEKKVEKTSEVAKNALSKLNGDTSLTKILSFDKNAIVQTSGSFTAGGFIPNIGQEPIVSYTAKTEKIGKVSNALSGKRGAYLLKVLSRTDFDSSLFKIQKEIISMNLLQTKKQKILTDWIENLKKNSEIEDNRDLFFR